MKVIDLLQRIANKEEVPKKIKVLFNVFVYDEDNYCYKNVDETLDSLLKHLAFYKGIVLNEEVIIIEDTHKEDKKIEKIGKDKIYNNSVVGNVFILQTKIDEIIDKINGDSNE